MTTSIGELETLGLVNVDYPQQPQSAVESAVNLWKQFCDLPSEIKTQFRFVQRHADGTGYEVKEEKGARKDLKENFQITQDDYSRLHTIAKNTKNPVAQNFIENARDLVNVIEPVVMQFAHAVENAYSLPGMAQGILDAKELWIVRYLHYFNEREPGEEIATSHIDKASFTLHLYESHGGLHYLSHQTREWLEMPVGNGQTVIIPAMQLQLNSEGKLKALYHRVVATEETAKTGRYSMVCFVPLKGSRLYNKDAKGRLQHYEPGFNYDLTHEQFAELFH